MRGFVLSGMIAVLAVAGPASAMEYSLTWDATMTFEGSGWGIYVSKDRDVLMINHRTSRKVQDVAEWRRVAEAFVAPLGCGIPEVHVVQPFKELYAGEVSYMCPQGVDLRQAIMSQRKRLKSGAPLVKPEAGEE